MRHYLRTLPLHPSQQETETCDEWSIFTYRMVPTWDLEHELLQYNDNVEVLAPQSLREQMAEHWLRNPKLDSIFECWFDTTGNGLTPLNGKDMTTPLGDGIGGKRDLF